MRTTLIFLTFVITATADLAQEFPSEKWVMLEENSPPYEVELPYTVDFNGGKPHWVKFSRSFTMEKLPVEPVFWSGILHSNSQVYVNGRFIGGQGWKTPEENVFRHRLFLPFSSFVLQSGTNEVEVWLWAAPGRKVQISNQSARPGERKVFERKRSGMLSLAVGFFIVFLFLGAYHLITFWQLPRFHYNLYFSLFFFTFAFYWLITSEVRFEIQDFFPQFLMQLEFTLLFWMGSFFIVFIHSFLEIPTPLIHRILIWGYALVSLLFFALPFTGQIFLLRLWQLSFPLFLVSSFWFSLRKSIAGNRDAALLAGGLGILTLTLVFDIIDNVFLNFGLKLAHVVFFLFLFAITVIVAARFSRTYRLNEELKNSLEEKVEQRTSQLNENLKIVKKLKEKQDGDYFLASLLLSPFQNKVKEHGVIELEFYLRQKTEFQFRNRDLEIGGDLIFSEIIQLHGRDYIVFANADAMGKSLQGAGGALVFGAILRSVVERTLQNPKAQKVYPERWVRNTVLDLQNAFEAFDGSMLVSFILGLIDAYTGVVYYVNAEHPHPVHIRGNFKTLLEQPNMIYKAGNPMQKQHFAIEVLQLSAGEALLLGSDGKDEVVPLGSDEINAGEDFFLETLSDGKQNPEKIFEELKLQAEIHDDFSLLLIRRKILHLLKSVGNPQKKQILNLARRFRRAGYPGRAMKLLEGLAGDAGQEVEKEKVLNSFMLLEYAQAYQSAEKYLQENPADSSILFLSSLASKRMGNLHRAADISERLFQREPQNEKNTAHLIEIYISLNRFDRVGQILLIADYFAMRDERIVRAKRLIEINETFREVA